MLEHGPKVIFKFQRDPSYQRFIDKKIANSLTESGFCWVACLEMALTYRGANQQPLHVPEELVDEFVFAAHQNNFLNNRGAIGSGNWVRILDMLNNLLPTFGLPSQFEPMKEPGLGDFAQDLAANKILIINISRKNNDHAIIADEVEHSDLRKNFIIRALDPGVSPPESPLLYFTGMGLDRMLREKEISLTYPTIRYIYQ